MKEIFYELMLLMKGFYRTPKKKHWKKTQSRLDRKEKLLKAKNKRNRKAL